MFEDVIVSSCGVVWLSLRADHLNPKGRTETHQYVGFYGYDDDFYSSSNKFVQLQEAIGTFSLDMQPRSTHQPILLYTPLGKGGPDRRPRLARGEPGLSQRLR